jgi:hypothetical protein
VVVVASTKKNSLLSSLLSMLWIVLSLLSLFLLTFAQDCDDLQSRLDTQRRVLHRGMHKQVHAATLRPNNDSVIVKRGPSKALQRELDVYDSLARRADFVPHLWGFCRRSSDMLFVQERVIPLAYASMCISLLGAAARVLFARRLADLLAQLIQRDLLHCDLHRGQIGLRLHDGVAQFVLLDAEQLTRAADVNRALSTARCSTDSQCQAQIQCYSIHRPYPRSALRRTTLPHHCARHRTGANAGRSHRTTDEQNNKAVARVKDHGATISSIRRRRQCIRLSFVGATVRIDAKQRANTAELDRESHCPHRCIVARQTGT